MTITASLVKELRERTGAGMMDCKKALQEAAGDINLAIENMRKSGQAKAAKKSGRVAAEGALVVKISDDGKAAVMIEVNSETDFVGRDENFQTFANQVAECALANKTSDVASLVNLPLTPDSDETVEQAREGLIAKVGENIQLRRLTLLDVAEGTLSSYSHGGRIGVLVHTVGCDDSLGKDVAMHIAASNPEVIKPDDLPESRIESEKEIFRAQALEEGKPADIVEKMIAGRVKKLFNELSLLGQEFIKDPSKSVNELLKEQGAQVISFTRYELGEGIEKKEDDFAKEVMAQVHGE